MLDLRPLKIVVTGANGFVGRHLMAGLQARGCRDVIPVTHRQHDLRIMPHAGMAIYGADVIFHLAAVCGGIGANQARPADFICDNLQIGLNVIRAAHQEQVTKLVMVGTLCAYPKYTGNEIKPSDLWKGYPEETNAPYGIAKRTLVEVGRAYHEQYGLNVVNVMPTNMYGTGDNFDPATSHVIPAMIRRFVEARDAGVKSVTCWGSGHPTRDFLHVSDAVEGIILAAEKLNDPEPVLLGSGFGVPMNRLAEVIAEVVGYTGDIKWDEDKPDGQPRRVVETTGQNVRLGFWPQANCGEKLRELVQWFGRHVQKQDAYHVSPAVS